MATIEIRTLSHLAMNSLTYEGLARVLYPCSHRRRMLRGKLTAHIEQLLEAGLVSKQGLSYSITECGVLAWDRVVLEGVG